MARHFQSPFRWSPHYSRPQRLRIDLSRGNFLQIKNHRRGLQPCWDMNWNERPLAFARCPSARECQLLRQFRMAAATHCPPESRATDIRDKWADQRQAFTSAACRPILSQRMDMPRIKTQRNEPAAIARGMRPSLRPHGATFTTRNDTSQTAEQVPFARHFNFWALHGDQAK